MITIHEEVLPEIWMKYGKKKKIVQLLGYGSCSLKKEKYAKKKLLKSDDGTNLLITKFLETYAAVCAKCKSPMHNFLS